MTVAYNQRTTPLSANSANAAWSNNVTVAYDFTGHDPAHADGTPWVFSGATSPTLGKDGSLALTTLNGEPCRVPAASSDYNYDSAATNWGMQFGNGDFTIGIRYNTPATLPASGKSQEFRLSGAAGTALSVTVQEDSGVGWYITTAGSTSCPLGSSVSATFYPVNRTFMIWIRRISGAMSIFTQDVTGQTNIVARNNAGATNTTPLDATWAAKTFIALSGTGGVAGVAAVKAWSVGHSDATLSAIGKNFWDTEANSSVADSIAITSPTTGSTIASTTTISGTYVGTLPTGIAVQHNGGSWVTGSSATIGSGAWSATFTLAAGTGSLLARETNQTTVVSPAITGITVNTDSIAFTVPGTPATAAVPFRTFQRDASNQASVRITGTYTGSPTTIQYQWNGGSWATLVASPSGGVFDATVTLTGPGQGDLSIRFSNNTGVNATIVSVGVGDVFIVAGQSNHVGGGSGPYVPASAPGAHAGWKASIYDKTGRWRENVETSTDPFSKTTNASIYGAAAATYAVQATSSTANNTYFGKLATSCMADGVPVAFVPCALGSTAISAWVVSTSTSTLYGAMLAVATTIGAHKAVLWWQGEADCTNATTRSSYESSLNALINDWVSRFTGAKWVLMNLNATGNTAGTGGTGASDTGFNAIHAAITNVAATNSNVYAMADMNGAFSSSIHYSTSPEITEVALRAYSAIRSMIVSVASVTLSLVSAAGAAASSLTGLKWAWFDQVTPDAFVAPTDKGSIESTDASGVLTVSLPNSTKTPGQVGWLIVTDSDGNPATTHKAFSGPVTVA